MKKLHFLFILIVLTFLHSSCKKVQPEMKELDCSCAKEVSADFTMEESGYFLDFEQYYTITDTIFNKKRVKFSALEMDAEYTWYIGSEILHTQSVERYFSDTWAGQDIPITLVVKKKPNRICFPDSDGSDSITKVLHVSQFTQETTSDFISGSLEGVYRFKSDHLVDSFDVTFFISKNQEIPRMEVNIENYDGLGSNCYENNGIDDITYRRCFIINRGYCELMEGNIHNRIDGTATMDFKLYYPNHPNYKQYHYKGRRISNL